MLILAAVFYIYTCELVNECAGRRASVPEIKVKSADSLEEYRHAGSHVRNIPPARPIPAVGRSFPSPGKASTADNELLTFDRFNRSTDDERSHVERYQILAKRFKQYLAKR